MAEEEKDAQVPAEEPTEATPPETDPEISEETAAEEQAPEQPAPEEPAAEAPADQPASDPAAPGGEAEEAAGSDVDSDDDSGKSREAAAAGSDSKSESKAKDAPPGAELEPIAIESEQELTAEERARREAEAEERASREAEATDESREEAPRRSSSAEVPAETRIQATGKRKSSIARVVLTAGDGSIEVNRRKLDEYFPRPHHQTVARQTLVTAGYEKTVDVRVRVHGGGISGQAGAVRHGIARALTEIEPELRRDLKRRGLLTRDARQKERRKAGLKKARKKPQFSKR